jgi:hypothetical protein
LERGSGPELAGDRLTFLGTATTLLRLGGFTLLADPNFLHRGQHVHLGYGLFSGRRIEPALQPAELPALDAMVLHLGGTRMLGVLVTSEARSRGLADGVQVVHPGQTVQLTRQLHGAGASRRPAGED